MPRRNPFRPVRVTELRPFRGLFAGTLNAKLATAVFAEIDAAQDAYLRALADHSTPFHVYGRKDSARRKRDEKRAEMHLRRELRRANERARTGPLAATHIPDPLRTPDIYCGRREWRGEWVWVFNFQQQPNGGPIFFCADAYDSDGRPALRVLLPLVNQTEIEAACESVSSIVRRANERVKRIRTRGGRS